MNNKIEIQTLHGVAMTRIRTTIKHGSGERNVDIELTPSETAAVIAQMSESLGRCIKHDQDHAQLLIRDRKIADKIADNLRNELNQIKSI